MDYAALASGAEDAIERALAGKVAGVGVATSGTTGEPRVVRIGAEALISSVAATHHALGGPGTWLLALPTDRIGGALVLARARLAGTPVARMPQGTFTASAFATATDALPREGPRYTSLVPTQLYRLAADPIGLRALEEFDAVLVGGAPVRHGGLPQNVITTYGATETCGGCVYDGVPLRGTMVDVRDGLVWIAGPTLADGYADGDDSRFVTEAGMRWFVTSDHGAMGPDGRLTILGRADDVVITGGVKVVPGIVERILSSQPWAEDAIVVGVPDAEWGEALAALVAVRPGHAMPRADEVRTALAASLSQVQIPRAIHAVEVLPRLSSGKIDRAEAKALATRLTEQQGEAWPE